MTGPVMKPQRVFCRKCGAYLGTIIDGTLFQVGGLLLQEVHGVCTNCGRGFHYNVTTKQIQRLLDEMVYNRVQLQRDNQTEPPGQSG